MGQSHRPHYFPTSDGSRRVRHDADRRLTRRCQSHGSGSSVLPPVTELSRAGSVSPGGDPAGAWRRQGTMADTGEHTVRPLLEAVAFAARAHQGKLRKDGVTPYVSHVF